jgi:hypothetical protein
LKAEKGDCHFFRSNSSFRPRIRLPADFRRRRNSPLFRDCTLPAKSQDLTDDTSSERIADGMDDILDDALDDLLDDSGSDDNTESINKKGNSTLGTTMTTATTGTTSGHHQHHESSEHGHHKNRRRLIDTVRLVTEHDEEVSFLDVLYPFNFFLSFRFVQMRRTSDSRDCHSLFHFSRRVIGNSFLICSW